MPGGATAPLPIADKPKKQVVIETPIPKGEKREVPATVARNPTKGKADPDDFDFGGAWAGENIYPYFYAGKSGKLDFSSSSRGPARAPRPSGRGFTPRFGGSTGARECAPFNTSRAGYDPFAGRPQKLDNAAKRMKEVYEARDPSAKRGKGRGSAKFFNIGD